MSRLPWQAVWFRDDNNFLYANSPSPPFDVPAYSGTFREHPTFREFPSMRRVQLCMLHTDDMPNFPDTSFVEDTYVKCCTEQTGLQLSLVTSDSDLDDWLNWERLLIKSTLLLSDVEMAMRFLVHDIADAQPTWAETSTSDESYSLTSLKTTSMLRTIKW